MNKPNGYDEARTIGEFTPVEPGGHYCKIKQVTEKTSSTGKPMIVVLFDFCDQDKQAGYFTNLFENDVREDSERKWPFQGSKYILVEDYKDKSKTSKQFKTFCSCVEKSNNYEIQWGGSSWGDQFKGKKIGMIYGMEESEYKGEITKRAMPQFFCKIDAVSTANVPAEKKLNIPGKEDFMRIPDTDKTEIPF